MKEYIDFSTAFFYYCHSVSLYIHKCNIILPLKKTVELPALILTKLANPQQHRAQITFRLDNKCGKYRWEL